MARHAFLPGRGEQPRQRRRGAGRLQQLAKARAFQVRRRGALRHIPQQLGQRCEPPCLAVERLGALQQAGPRQVGLALLPGWAGVAGYVLGLLLLTPGFQLFLAANNTAVMLGAADAHQGLASGLLGLSRNLGLLAGAALLPLLFAALLGGPVADSSMPAIGAAFRATFLAAAGVLAVLAAWLCWPRRARRPKD